MCARAHLNDEMLCSSTRPRTGSSPIRATNGVWSLRHRNRYGSTHARTVRKWSETRESQTEAAGETKPQTASTWAAASPAVWDDAQDMGGTAREPPLDWEFCMLLQVKHLAVFLLSHLHQMWMDCALRERELYYVCALCAILEMHFFFI